MESNTQRREYREILVLNKETNIETETYMETDDTNHGDIRGQCVEVLKGLGD